MNVDVIIPALNEAGNIETLVRETLAQSVRHVLVVDNNSTDETGALAKRAGAHVIVETRRGYGYACAVGVAASDADVLVFLDGDFSFAPSELPRLLVPLAEQRADLVLGSRKLGYIEPGSMPVQQRFGNALIAWLIRGLYGLTLTDLGPYRAVRRHLVSALDMREMTYGWHTEMIIKVARRLARIVEVPVSWYSRRAGQSKVSGTLRGTILAGYHLLTVTLRYAR